MYYYKFTAHAVYCGTDNEYHVATKEPLTDKEIDEMREEYARENAESFEYLVTGGKMTSSITKKINKKLLTTTTRMRTALVKKSQKNSTKKNWELVKTNSYFFSKTY